MVEAVDSRLPRFGGDGDGEDEAVGGIRTMAERANALDVYEDAVQEPLLECSNLASMYYQAQEIGSTRPEAKILREDFCSSAIVAQTWLGLEKDHHAQGVDIDLAALKIAKRRLEAAKRRDRAALLIRSASFSSSGQECSVEVTKSDVDDHCGNEKLASQPSTSTWSDGAASDRFERRFQARLAKEQAKNSSDSSVRVDNDGKKQTLTLLHADVLELPLKVITLEAPDIIYAGNYALSYFHDRSNLVAYLKQCRRTLRAGTGTLIVDPFAGPTAWDASSSAECEEQQRLWTKFAAEPGFLRSGELRPPSPLKGDVLEFWRPGSASSSMAVPTNTSDWRYWPRGRLVLVRKGNVGGGYEYWREDGPLDYSTNRFRMSLSFRFRDGSWLRDYFSYDFRVWSLREITEAMREVGFERVSVHAIPRTVANVELDNAAEAQDAFDASEGHEGENEDDDDAANGLDDSLDGMADLMRQTEIHESEKHTYKELDPSEKVFAKRSFGTYVVACMPTDGS